MSRYTTLQIFFAQMNQSTAKGQIRRRTLAAVVPNNNHDRQLARVAIRNRASGNAQPTLFWKPTVSRQGSFCFLDHEPILPCCTATL